MYHNTALQSAAAGAGELHLEICLKDLQEEYMGGAEIRVSDPVVSFRETVTGTSDHTVMAKSPNKHNRLYMIGRPLEEGLAEAIDDGKVTPRDDPKERTKVAWLPSLTICTVFTILDIRTGQHYPAHGFADLLCATNWMPYLHSLEALLATTAAQQQGDRFEQRGDFCSGSPFLFPCYVGWVLSFDLG